LIFKARHSTTAVPIYITIDPNSPASIVYHDHSYFIRHESTNSSLNSSTDNIHRRKSSISNTKSIINNQPQTQQQQQQQTSLPSVQVLNRLLLEHQQKTKNSPSDSSINPSTSSTNTIDFSAILRALLAKQGHHITSVEKKVNDNTENTLSPPSSSSPSQPVITSQLQSDSSSTAAL
jgi:hypothetical protein